MHHFAQIRPVEMTATARGTFKKPSEPLEPSAPFPPLPFHVKHDHKGYVSADFYCETLSCYRKRKGYKGYKGVWEYRYPTIHLNAAYHLAVVSLASFRPIVLVLCDIDVLT